MSSPQDGRLLEGCNVSVPLTSSVCQRLVCFLQGCRYEFARKLFDHFSRGLLACVIAHILSHGLAYRLPSAQVLTSRPWGQAPSLSLLLPVIMLYLCIK